MRFEKFLLKLICTLNSNKPHLTNGGIYLLSGEDYFLKFPIQDLVTGRFNTFNGDCNQSSGDKFF